MRTSKARRQYAKKTAALEQQLADTTARLEKARTAWPALAGENARLREEKATTDLAHIRARRLDLARVSELHHKVLRRGTSGPRSERFYCPECNVLFPCRTITVIGKLAEQLDGLYREAKAS
jgi:hypothetical protein